jgi:mannose-6-phosphate isomerase-like protein (cupin superfamily)
MIERELERMREPEVRVLHDYKWNEDRVIHHEQQREMVSRLPKILKYENVPWEQVWASNHKIFNSNEPAHEHKKLLPLQSMTLREQILPPGQHNGQHRHFPEVLFFILEGNGWEMHDEHKWPWSKWDAMCVPTYCTHQHFADDKVGARLFYVGTGLFDLMGLRFRSMQFQIDGRFQVPPGGEGIYTSEGQLVGYKRGDGVELRFVGESTQQDSILEEKLGGGLPQYSGSATTYDGYVQRFSEEGAWRNQTPHVVRQADRPWEDTRMGRLKYLIHPSVPSGILTLDAWIQEIPPGGRTGKHVHAAEETHKILQGEGYDIIDGERIDWKAEDVTAYPAFSVHQHFNTSKTESACFYSVSPRMPEWINHGGYRHLEDAYTP